MWENINLIIWIILVELFTSIPLIIFFILYQKIKIRVILKRIIIFSLILLWILWIIWVIFLNFKEKIVNEFYFWSEFFYLWLFFSLICFILFWLIILNIYKLVIWKIIIEFEDKEYLKNDKINLSIWIIVNKKFFKEKLNVFIRWYKLVYNSNSRNRSYKKRFEKNIITKELNLIKWNKEKINLNFEINKIIQKNNLFNDSKIQQIKQLIWNSVFWKELLKNSSEMDLWKIEVEFWKIYEEKIIIIK